MKTILYGHAWMSGGLTAFAFFGYLRALNTSFTPPRQVWVWVIVLAVGLLWTVLGFSYVASRDWHEADGDRSKDPPPTPDAGRPTEEVAVASRRRAAPGRYLGPLLMLAVFWAGALLLVAAANDWWVGNIGRPGPAPLPSITPTSSRSLPPHTGNH